MGKKLFSPPELTVGYLGPAGTHSHDLAVSIFKGNESVRFRFQGEKTFEAIFEAIIAGKVCWGVVPYVNTTSGPVETVYKYTEEPKFYESISICASIYGIIDHALLSSGDGDCVNAIYSKREAYQQCQKYVDYRFPGHVFYSCESTSQAVKSAYKNKNAIAIGSKAMINFHKDIKILSDKVQDNANNTTEFLILSRRDMACKNEGVKIPQQTWLSLTSSFNQPLLQKLLITADKWGVSATALSGKVSEAHQYTIRYLVRLQAPLNSLKMNFILNESEYMGSCVVSSPYIFSFNDENMTQEFRNWLNNTATQNKSNDFINDTEAIDSLKPEVISFLSRMRKEAYELIVHPPAGKMKKLWEVLHVHPRQILNSQVYNSDSGIIFCCVHGDKMVDEGKVSLIIGERIRRVPMEKLTEPPLSQTIGSISPLTAPPGSTILIDNEVIEDDFLFIGSGDQKISIYINLGKTDWPSERRVQYCDIKLN